MGETVGCICIESKPFDPLTRMLVDWLEPRAELRTGCKVSSNAFFHDSPAST